MSEINRRDFLSLGIAAAAGMSTVRLPQVGNLETTALLNAANSFERMGPLETSFLLEWQRFSMLEPTTGAWANPTPWMLPDTVSEADAWKMANFSLERLERWVTDYCAACEAPEPIGNVLSSADISASSVKPIPAIMMPLAGLPNTYDLVGQIDEVLKRGEQVDMSLNFFYEPQFEAIVGTASTMASSFPVQDNADILAVPSGVLLGGDDFFIDAPPSVTLHGWRLQFRGPDNHPLGSCVTQFVKHYNIELFRRQSNGSYKYVTNLHIGAYRSGGRRCFVLWNNLRPVVCWKICSPTWEQLKQMLSWVLIAAAAIVGIALAAWVIAAIASAASSALWLPLLALA